MEFFKTDVLRKEFEQFQKEVSTGVLNCGLCQKTACEDYHHKYWVSCKFCRENNVKRVKNLILQKTYYLKALTILYKNMSTILRDFLSFDKLNYSFKGQKRTFYKIF